jgi:signal transduction histidine kinase
MPEELPIEGGSADADGHGIASRNDLLLLGLALTALSALLLWLSEYDYLFFHVLVEFVSIVIGYCIFAFTITSRRILDGYLVIIGVGFFFFGTIDLLHTLTYKGMDLLTSDAGLATQLWIIARYGQATTFLVASFWVGRKAHVGRLFAVMAAISIVMVSLAFLDIFPACYVEGEGLTAFKVVSEYVICLMLGASLVLFYMKRKALDRRVMWFLLASIAFSIAAEVSFTNYINVYGFFNALGHLLRLVSVVLIYIAIVEMAVSRPVDSLFKKLSDSERRYRTLLEVTPSLVVVMNADGAMENCNRRMAETISSRSSVQLDEARKAFVEDQLAAGLEATRRQGRTTFRADLMTPTGRRAILWNAAAESLGEERLVIMSGIDITEREKDRERIEDLNDFFYILNRITMHDLRNRLMEVNGNLRRYQKRGLPEDLSNAADSANAGAETLRRLEMLSRSIRARPQPTTWDLRAISEAVVRESGERDKIRVEGQCHALVDDAFSSVLENIVNNAFRHGKADQVLISLAQKDGRALITVSDNGMGIPDSIKGEIFTSGFSHGSSANTGMGLFIARKLVEGYGGNIDVEDNQPHGAKFTIELLCEGE